MYLYLTDREKLIGTISHHLSKKGQVVWEDAVEELNLVFNETVGKHIWKDRYYRALSHTSGVSLGLPSAISQQNTEGHLKRLNALEKGRASVLSEEALRILQQNAKHIEFNAEFKDSKQDDEYVFVTSDFHFDGDENMLGALAKAYAHIVAKQKELGFKKIKLIELGDTVEGSHLRPSQLLAIKTMLIPQTITIAQAYVEFLNKLTETMAVDFYVVTSSNHTQTRAFGSGRNEFVEDDAMLIFAEVVKVSTSKNKNIKFTSGRDLVLDLTPRHKMFVAHGHLIEGKKSGYVQELAMSRGIKFDYALFGHFHHYREMTIYGRESFNMKIFYAPSMNSKHSDYEFDRNLSSKAGILFMVFNENRGHRYCEELFL